MNFNNNNINFSEITPEINELTKLCLDNSTIDPMLYKKFDVKRGLRDVNGKGVLTGLTEISEIISNKIVDGESVPCIGELYYRGYNIEDIITGSRDNNHFAFEESTYLLLFGKLPSKQDLEEFEKLLSKYRQLP
ncbi:MAG: citrate/2-methylcitrate synthase, partial [Oscillospiraceae bacterium]